MFPDGRDPKAPGARGRRQALDHLFGLDLRPQPTVDGPYNAVDPPIKWHFAVPGPEAPPGGAGQSHPAQLRLPRGATGQRGHPRAGGADPGHAAPRAGAAGGGGAPAGDRARAAGRADRPHRLSPLRRDRLQRPEPLRGRDEGGPAAAAPGGGHPAHGGHQPGCHRGLGVRPAGPGGPAAAPGRAPPGGAALRRRALLGGHRAELLDEGRSAAGADRPVHQQRLQERDAVVHRRRSIACCPSRSAWCARTWGPSGWDGTRSRKGRSSSAGGPAWPTSRRSCGASCRSRRC